MTKEKPDTSLETLLTFMSAAKPVGRNKRMAVDKPLTYFSGAFPILGGGFGDSLVSEEAGFIPADAEYKDIDYRIDLPLIFTLKNDDDPTTVADTDSGFLPFILQRARSISRKAARGRVIGVRRYMLEYTMGTFLFDGSYTCGSNIIGSQNGVRWQHLSPKTKGGDPFSAQDLPSRACGPGGSLSEQEEFNLKLSYGIQFIRPMYWTVGLQFEGYPKVNFFTDPTGAREVFRLRDVPPGKKRRVALRNWITAHWRKKHDDPDALIEVRKHLRGATEFHWNGLFCTVSPSKDDLEENERLRIERAAR